MREITPRLTPELEKHNGSLPVWRAPAFGVRNFRSLVEQVARLAYANPDALLFFRGQDKDYQSKVGGTTLYPAIYRSDSVSSQELQHRFDLLDQAARLLVARFKAARIEGHREVRHKRYIQWSILQHYEVVATPLLDVTQSLRVACSFAGGAYVADLAMYANAENTAVSGHAGINSARRYIGEGGALPYERHSRSSRKLRRSDRI